VKIAFDIGGVISRYPDQMKTIIQALMAGGVDVCIVTDMPPATANILLRLNGFDFVPSVYCGNWTEHGDMCKSLICEREGIDVLFDDRPDYCALGNFIGFVLAPRPQIPYYAQKWINDK
jgi:hypothetical protein